MTSMNTGHKAADAMDWNEAMQLIQHMYDDGKFRDAACAEDH